jgi:uncharacterized membrane protein
MSTQRVALLVAVLFAGLFAGLMFTFSVVIERVMVTLSASEYTKVMQGLIRGADVPPIVPAVVIVAWLAPLVALWQMRHDRTDPAFRLTLIGWIIFTAGVFVFTVAFNLPINQQITQWSIQSPPSDWAQLRDRWDQYNLIRTPASILAFLCFTLALAVSREKSDHVH